MKEYNLVNQALQAFEEDGDIRWTLGGTENEWMSHYRY